MHVWGATHALPQTPQLAGSVASVTSQPFAGLLSQFARPAAQAVTPHASLVQVAADAVFGTGHAMQAAPQVAGSLLGTHAPPQRWCVAGHVVPQVSATQVAVPPPAGTGHTVQAAPQAVASVLATHLVPQRRVLTGHCIPHVSATQVGTPPVGAGQGVQAAPHFAGSVLATQAPEQAWNCALHVKLQVPPAQAGTLFSGAGHLMLHPPQWLMVVLGSTQEPPQFTGASAVQPLVHWNEPPAGAQSGAATWQTALQEPQLVALERSVSQPSPGSLLQSA